MNEANFILNARKRAEKHFSSTLYLAHTSDPTLSSRCHIFILENLTAYFSR